MKTVKKIIQKKVLFLYYVVVISSSSFILNSSIFAVEISLRELADISSLRDNQVSGYGLVVGLTGSGDSRNYLGKETMKALLNRRGIEPDIKDRNFNSKNIAAVFVSAVFPPGASAGDRMDVWISSVGDAKSLAGGYLLQTPLLGADGKIYAVAQARVPTMNEERSGNSRENKKNTFLLSRAAIIEQKVDQRFTSTYQDENDNIITFMSLSLRNFDLSNAIAAVQSVNKAFPNSTRLDDNGKIIVIVPKENPLEFISQVLEVKVDIRETTRVVVNPSTGTIVMGGGVSISKVSVSKNGINIDIKNNATNFNNNLRNDREELPSKAVVLEESVTVDDLVSGLNKLGLPTQDIIDILRAIDTAGALHGKLEVL